MMYCTFLHTILSHMILTRTSLGERGSGGARIQQHDVGNRDVGRNQEARNVVDAVLWIS